MRGLETVLASLSESEEIALLLQMTMEAFKGEELKSSGQGKNKTVP